MICYFYHASRGAWLFCLLCAIFGCAGDPSVFHDAAATRGKANEALDEVETLQRLESQDLLRARVAYEKLLGSRSVHSVESTSLAEVQKDMEGTINSQTKSGGLVVLVGHGELGFADNYAKWLEVTVRAKQGLARLAKQEGALDKAEELVLSANELLKSRGATPHQVATSLLQNHRILQEVYVAKGLTGKALVQRLHAQLLEDHLASEQGVDNWYTEKVFLIGSAAQQQFDIVQQLVTTSHDHLFQKIKAESAARGAAIFKGMAAFQQLNAQQALVKSGGVLTPQVQSAQLNAQLSQFVANVVSENALRDAGLSHGGTVGSSSWVIPTFAQQLIDPKMGINPQGIIKGFATEAATLGNAPTLTQGAQQVIQAVDGLPTVQANSDAQAIVQSVESFAGIFNSFLTQVQEIKARP